MISKPPIRTIRMRNSANTWTLVEDVIYAAMLACHAMRTIPSTRRDAPADAHAMAAALTYSADMNDQTIKMPHVLQRDGVGDCKSTAVYCAAIGYAAGCSVELCFLQYDAPHDIHWQHVFAILDGVPCDPLLPLGQVFPYLRCIKAPIR